MNDKQDKIVFPLKDAAMVSAFMVAAMMNSIPNRLDALFRSGHVPEPRIKGEDGQDFDCLYQYHAYLWGKYGKEKADKMVDDFKKEMEDAFKRMFDYEDNMLTNCENVSISEEHSDCITT